MLGITILILSVLGFIFLCTMIEYLFKSESCRKCKNKTVFTETSQYCSKCGNKHFI